MIASLNQRQLEDELMDDPAIETEGIALFTATENALVQDGPAASPDTGSPSRIVSFDADTGELLAQYLYPTEPTPLIPTEEDGFSTNGLVELLALDEHHLLSLERGFADGAGNDIRLYEIDTQQATDISAIDSLAASDAMIRPVEKTLLANLNDYGFAPDNVEGMALGPVLEDGRQSLILTADDNFSDTQSTQFIALSLALEETTTPTPDPGFDIGFGLPSLLPPALDPFAIMGSLMSDIAGLPGGHQALAMPGNQGNAMLAGVTDTGEWLMPG